MTHCSRLLAIAILALGLGACATDEDPVQNGNNGQNNGQNNGGQNNGGPNNGVNNGVNNGGPNNGGPNNGVNNGGPNNGQGATCQELEAAYAALLDEHTSCVEHADCQRVNGQCSVGLGGCYHAVNNGLTQDELSALGMGYNDAGCTQGVCDCAEPEPVFCDGGTCAFGPDCGGRTIGESFPADAECNTCTCTVDGIACTDRACDPCQSIENDYNAAIENGKLDDLYQELLDESEPREQT